MIRDSSYSAVDCSTELLYRIYSEILETDDSGKLQEIVSDWQENGGKLIMGPRGSRRRELIAGYLLLTENDYSPMEIREKELPLGYDALKERLETGLWELKHG